MKKASEQFSTRRTIAREMEQFVLYAVLVSGAIFEHWISNLKKGFQHL